MSSLAKFSLSKPSSANRRRLVAAPLFAGLLIGALAGAAPARAQFFIDEPEMRLPPRVVVANLARRGYRDITHPAFDGETYTLTAADPRGIRVRLVLDAFDGAVLDRVRFEAAPVPPGFIGRPTRPGYGWTEEEPETRPIQRVERPQRGESHRPPVAARPAADPGGPAIAPPAPMAAAPSGMNPDAGRPAAARPETRAARAPDAAKPGPKAAEPRAVPAAPVPTITPAEAAKAPERPRLEAAKPVPAPKLVEPKAAETASPLAAQPAAEPPQRQVRVIEGVTPPNAAPAAKPAEATTDSGS